MKLLLVLTFKGSLEKWQREGIVRRELEVCIEYLKRDLFSNVVIFTYGQNDQDILNALNIDDDIKNRFEFVAPDTPVTSVFGAIRHSLNIRKIKQAVQNGVQIARTNQINGCWTAWLVRLCGGRFYLRCGYILSRRLYKNKKYLQAFIALLIEFIGFNLADMASVTTNDAKAYVTKLMFNKRKCFVAPTYVNTDIFASDIDIKPDDNSIVYIGRIENQKNILEMVRAASIAGISLVVVGKGRTTDEMLSLSGELGVKIDYHPVLSNEEIAELLKRHKYFILPSLHEGLPKVLIEAMAADMVCIGTPISGTTALIQHGETGYLSKDVSAQSLAEAIKSAQADPDNKKIAKNARAFIMERHTIKSYVDREEKEIKDVLAR